MLFIFDWDGTLCKSLDRIVISVQRAAGDLNIEVPASDRVQSIVGLGLVEAMNELFPLLADDRRAEMVDRYKYHFVDLDTSVPSPLYDGALELLHSLRSSNHKIAVATGKSRVGLDRALHEKDLIDFFDTTRCADETRSKPHPQMLHEILDELNHSAEESVMIGDTEFDLEMANSANMRSVAMTYGAHPIERLEKCRPHLIADKLITILDHF